MWLQDVHCVSVSPLNERHRKMRVVMCVCLCVCMYEATKVSHKYHSSKNNSRMNDIMFGLYKNILCWDSDMSDTTQAEDACKKSSWLCPSVLMIWCLFSNMVSLLMKSVPTERETETTFVSPLLWVSEWADWELAVFGWKQVTRVRSLAKLAACSPT